MKEISLLYPDNFTPLTPHRETLYFILYVYYSHKYKLVSISSWQNVINQIIYLLAGLSIN